MKVLIDLFKPVKTWVTHSNNIDENFHNTVSFKNLFYLKFKWLLYKFTEFLLMWKKELSKQTELLESIEQRLRTKVEGNAFNNIQI